MTKERLDRICDSVNKAIPNCVHIIYDGINWRILFTKNFIYKMSYIPFYVVENILLDFDYKIN